MVDSSHNTKSPKETTPKESSSFMIERFLENREDEIFLHPETESDRNSRKHRLQAVIDRVDRLGLSGDGEKSGEVQKASGGQKASEGQKLTD